MKTFKKMLAAVGSACLSVALATAAGAETVTLQFTNVDPGLGVDLKLDGQKDSTLAGKFEWDYVSGSTILGPSPITSFCIEIDQYISYGGVFTYDLINLESAPKPGAHVGIGAGMGVDRANALRELWGRHFDEIGNDNFLAREFQLAVWEIVYDFGSVASKNVSFVDGIFSSCSTDGTALAWLNSLTGDTSKYASLAAISSGAQDQVVRVNSGDFGPPAVPLPVGVYGGAVLLAGLGIRAARTRRQPAQI